ncbi:MAG TPA: Hsp33 family molecular chaperone HslO [Haloplasmataceae bacterium]
MNDYIVRAMAFHDTVRIYTIRGTGLVGKAQEIHHTLPSATAALGRTLIIGAMMGAMLKDDQRLTIRIKGDGPIGEILVDARANGNVRGYVANPLVHYQYPDGKLNVAQTVGTKGEIQVIKDLGLKDFYTSSIELVSGELGEDFTYYFAKSEQIPSAVGAGVLVETDNRVRAAGGFILQLLPGATEETINTIEKRLSQMMPVSEMVDKGYTPEQMVEVLAGDDHHILSKQPVQFFCDCSKDRFGKSLASLGKETLNEMIEEDGKAEIVCHFCRSKYGFTKEELIAIRDMAQE